MEDSDIEDLRAAGWDERGIYEATALVSLFNYSGRIEAAAGLRVFSYRQNEIPTVILQRFYSYLGKQPETSGKVEGGRK